MYTGMTGNRESSVPTQNKTVTAGASQQSNPDRAGSAKADSCDFMASSGREKSNSSRGNHRDVSLP